MGQTYKYSSSNFKNENFYDKISSMIINIINLLLTLLKELTNDRDYKSQFKLPQYQQDTTNWNNPYGENQFTRYNEFKNINEYYSHENLHSFFSKYNDIGKRLNINEYSYPKNGRQCFSCGNSYSHQCCIACKRTIANCECVFICGLSNPCQYDKKGDVTQYRKCKYYTSDLNNFNHNCKGIVFENGQIVTFDTQDNRSYHSYNIL